MSRKNISVNFVLIVSIFVMFGCNFGGNSQSSSPEEEATLIPPVIETSQFVNAEAFVVPIKDVNLAFEKGGRIVEILVREGEAVQAGQVIVRLNDADARANIAIAEASLVQAQANLANIKAGTTAEQIRSAEIAIDRAEANLAQVAAGPTQEEIAISQARVDTLRAQLNQVLAGPREESIRASLASVKQAEADLALAQADYDKIAYAADSEVAQPIALALQSATLRYEAALANHEILVNGATAQEIAVVRAQVAEGQAALNQLLAGARAEQITLAHIGVLEAEASLDQVMASATEENIAIAEASVQQAEAALAQAQLALDKLELKAPFAGTVVTLNAEIGEIISSGSSVAVLADLSTWRIETDDLTEIDIVDVFENQPAIVQIDALPEESFDGVVLRIKEQPQVKAGDVTYTVVIDLVDNQDPRLRWGMTSFVEISTE